MNYFWGPLNFGGPWLQPSQPPPLNPPLSITAKIVFEPRNPNSLLQDMKNIAPKD